MFSVYSDDFIKEGDSGFGYATFGHLALVMPDEFLETTEHYITDLKRRHNINNMHINNLLNRQYREKNNIKEDDVYNCYNELSIFLSQFTMHTRYFSYTRYLNYDLQKVCSIKKIEFMDGKQEIFEVNNNTILWFLESNNSLVLKDNRDIKFYREQGTHKANMGKAFINNNYALNRLKIPYDAFKNDIKIIQSSDAPYQSIYEIADFLAYIYGCAAHDNCRKIIRKMNKPERIKYTKIFEWCAILPCIQGKADGLFGINLKHMKIIDGVLKWDI